MAYDPTSWQDRNDNAEDDYLIDGERKTIKKYDGEVIEYGTTQNASKMNKIEQGIKDAHDNIDNLKQKETIKTGLTLLESNWVDNTGTTGYWEYTVTDSDVSTDSVVDIYFNISDLQTTLKDIGLAYVKEQSGGYLFQFENKPSADVNYKLIINKEVI